MLFNSLTFWAFFVVVYALYLRLQGRTRIQNVFLLLASIVFYGCWDYRFLVLLLVSAGIDYWAGLAISSSASPAHRKRVLTLSITINLGILAFFKYYNFFSASLASLLRLLGFHADFFTLHVLLPVGISFYTFQSMSYGIDIYRGKLEPTRDLLSYFLMVAFFPHLVAGPIVRASRLLPQMLRARVITVDQVNAGLWLILWGLWKKVVMADNLSDIANNVFNSPDHFRGLDVTIGILAFCFQIYGDFSGYTDIARGLAKLLGFELDLNFDQPYFALSPSEFWHRWHISLSTWLRDYLYIPLGGNRGKESRTRFNLMATMVLGGLWHGAAWNFVIWGFYHGAILSLYRSLETLPAYRVLTRQRWLIPLRWGLMFTLTCVGWVIFRAVSAHDIVHLLADAGMGHRSWYSVSMLYRLVLFTLPLAVMEIWQYVRRDALVVTRTSLPFSIFVYGCLLLSIAIFAKRDAQAFIYFQF